MNSWTLIYFFKIEMIQLNMLSTITIIHIHPSIWMHKKTFDTTPLRNTYDHILLNLNWHQCQQVWHSWKHILIFMTIYPFAINRTNCNKVLFQQYISPPFDIKDKGHLYNTIHILYRLMFSTLLSPSIKISYLQHSTIHIHLNKFLPYLHELPIRLWTN